MLTWKWSITYLNIKTLKGKESTILYNLILPISGSFDYYQNYNWINNLLPSFYQSFIYRLCKI